MKRLCNRVISITALAVFFLFAASICLGADKPLFMATTTSTDNTGLLDYLSAEFSKDTGTGLQWVATGTGKALKLGENCDADVLLVHAPGAEKAYIEAGFGIDRREIMYNDFVLIGPDADPAGIKSKNVTQALTAIAQKGAEFISRGDNSGTNKKEKNLWKAAGIPLPDKESWYVQTGQGMLATINVAAEKKAYTMTDRGTYIKYEDSKQGHPDLKIVVEGDAILLNQYSVIAVNPKHCEMVQYQKAGQFSEWLAGDRAQNLIREFKLLGKPLFIPNAK